MKKPKIMILCDLEGWAWDIKSKQIQKWLDPYYDIDIDYSCYNPNLKIDKSKYDLLFTYGFAFTNQLLNGRKNRSKCISGVTAHRKKVQIQQPMNSVDHHHANSVLLYNELKKMGKKPYYVPNGVDEKLFFPIKPLYNKRPYLSVGHIGKKSPNKNQTSFLEPVIKSMKLDYHPHYNDFSNAIPHDKMIHKYQYFDIFIASSSEDGTPNGMLESMACGRPVIINKIGNAPELIKDGYNGFIVDMNQDAYRKMIQWCIENPTKVVKMGENALKSILEGWTWKHMSRNYLYMFDKILGIKREKSLYDNPALYHIKDYYRGYGL